MQGKPIIGIVTIFQKPSVSYSVDETAFQLVLNLLNAKKTDVIIKSELRVRRKRNEAAGRKRGIGILYGQAKAIRQICRVDGQFRADSGSRRAA